MMYWSPPDGCVSLLMGLRRHGNSWAPELHRDGNGMFYIRDCREDGHLFNTPCGETEEDAKAWAMREYAPYDDEKHQKEYIVATSKVPPTLLLLSPVVL